VRWIDRFDFRIDAAPLARDKTRTGWPEIFLGRLAARRPVYLYLIDPRVRADIGNVIGPRGKRCRGCHERENRRVDSENHSNRALNIVKDMNISTSNSSNCQNEQNLITPIFVY
jgi:hypothetical protein